MRRGHRSRPRPVRVLARAQPRPRHRPRSQDRIRRGREARQGGGGEERHGATTRDGEGCAQGQGPRSRARSAGDDGVGRARGAEITGDFVGGGPLAGMEFATLLWLCTIALSTLGSGVWYDKVRPLLKATFWSWLVRMNVAGLIVGLLVK